MTNEEFFENELKAVVKRVKEDLLIDQIAVNKQGQPKCCITQSCTDCIFNGHCAVEAKKQWLKQEHVEQVDWSKVKVDTPILVRDYESEEWADSGERCLQGGGFEYMHGWWHKFLMDEEDENKIAYISEAYDIPSVQISVRTDFHRDIYVDVAIEGSYHTSDLDVVTETIYELTKAGLLEIEKEMER